ncbi:MAG: hypothetical protein ACLU38_06525 [Dysosmobacter sp.]
MCRTRFRTIGSLFGLGGLPRSDVLARYYFDSYSGVFLASHRGRLHRCPPRSSGSSPRMAPAKRSCPLLEPVVLLALLTVVTAYLVDGSFNPFLYFRF